MIMEPGTFWVEYRVNGRGAWHGPEYGFEIPRHHDGRRYFLLQTPDIACGDKVRARAWAVFPGGLESEHATSDEVLVACFAPPTTSPTAHPTAPTGLAHAETDTRPYGRADARARGRADGGADAGAHARTDDEPDAGTDADAHA